MNILEKIVEKTRLRVAKAKENLSLDQLKNNLDSLNFQKEDFLFEKALKQNGVSFICEVKKASPSKGVIAEDFPYLDIAKDYEKAGASAISVLTETDFFLGKDEYLKEISQNVKIPVLRKDFTIDEYQIYEAKLLGASGVLLICSILTKQEIENFISIADSLGLSCLVEAHDEEEIEKALLANARIIGVNNRNLKTFVTDINNSIILRKKVPSEILFVAESGIKTSSDISKLNDNKIDAVLIGETLMRSENKVEAFKTLRRE